MTWNRRRRTIGCQRPVEFLFAEVLRHRDGEDAPLAPVEKMSRLALVYRAGLDFVLRSDRNIQLLFCVAVHVSEQHIETAVRIRKPSFESGCDALSGIVQRLAG